MIYRVWEIPGIKVPPPNERILKIVMSPEVTGTKQLTLLVSIISPGYTTGSHKHDVDEFMYVATGRGTFFEEGQSQNFEMDSILFGKANTEHEVRNTGVETLKLICAYAPPLKPKGFIEQATQAAKNYWSIK
ncbi:MAG: cupin domain-containing protein [Nitrososphaeria archaeon]